LNEAALAIAGDLDLDRVLETILKTAAKLVGAQYGALGIPDGRGGFYRECTGCSARSFRRANQSARGTFAGTPSFPGIRSIIRR